MTIRVFYIISTGYSGSTLLNLLLSSHPGIGTIGEHFYLSSRIINQSADLCSCGEKISGCEFLRKAYDQGTASLPKKQRNLRYTEYNFQGQPLLDRFCRDTLSMTAPKPWLQRWHPCAHAARSLVAANAAVASHVLEQTGASVYLDASKVPLNALLMSASPEFDVTLIRLTRDGRAWFNSVLRRHPGIDPEYAARGFVKSVRHIKRAARKWHPNKVINVGYEHLCDNTESVLDSILARMRLDPAERRRDFERLERHIIGNATVVRNGPIQILDACAWREELSSKERVVFERIAGRTNRALGYT